MPKTKTEASSKKPSKQKKNIHPYDPNYRYSNSQYDRAMPRPGKCYAQPWKLLCPALESAICKMSVERWSVYMNLFTSIWSCMWNMVVM